MRRALAVACLFAAGCTAPLYGDGHLQCAASGRLCPDGFYCAGDHRCWKNGSGPTPDLATLLDLGGGADLSAPDASLDLSMPDLAMNPSLCAGLGVKLCDGFETGAVDTATWNISTDNGTVTVDSQHVYRGRYALHLHHNAVTTSTGGAADASVIEYKTFPITGTVYARAWMYLPSPIIMPVSQIINYVDNSGNGVSMVVDDGHPGINDYTPPPQYQASGSLLVPRDRWTCLELQLDQSGTTGNVHIYIDGQEADFSLTGAPTPTAVGVYFSLYYYMPPMLPAEDMWVDEVIVDDKPVTCAE